MKVKFLSDYSAKATGESGQKRDRRADTRVLVESVGGWLESVIVTYNDVDSVQFVAVLQDEDAVDEMAAAIRAAGGDLAETTILESSGARALKTHAAKAAGLEPASFRLGSTWA